MLLKRRLKAGILLYALFMAAAFALLLQFYLSRVQAGNQVQTVQYQETQACLMAEMTKALADKEKGSYHFDQGSTNYSHQKNQLTVAVQLNSGQSYTFTLLKPERQEDSPSETDKTPDSESSATKPEAQGQLNHPQQEEEGKSS